MKIEFFDSVLKKAQMSGFIKIRPVGAEFFHADEQMGGRTDGRA